MTNRIFDIITYILDLPIPYAFLSIKWLTLPQGLVAWSDRDDLDEAFSSMSSAELLL